MRLNLFSYCRLLPPREIAKSFWANGMVGRGSGDRTNTTFKRTSVYRRCNHRSSTNRYEMVLQVREDRNRCNLRCFVPNEIDLEQ